MINEKQWGSNEIIQLTLIWEQKEELYNASPDYSNRDKRSEAIKKSLRNSKLLKRLY